MITTRGRRISKPTTITVSGRLSSAVRSKAVVSMRVSGYGAAGRDRRLERHLRHPLARFQASVFVGHVLGTADHTGAGTKPLIVDVRKPTKR